MNFQIETVAGCNLSCAECPVRMIQRPGDSRYLFMSREVWDTIISRYVIPYRELNAHLNAPTLIPHKDGEPLLNKNLPDYLRSVPAGMNIDIYTHGLLLPKKPDFLPFLGSVTNKVRLLVSFHFNNHDGSVNDYAATTAYFKRHFDQPWTTPRNVEIVFASHLVAPMTAERLNAWKESWRAEIDAGKVTVHANVAINPWTGLIEGDVVKHPGCPYHHFDHVFFGVTGNVIACCMDLEEEIVFGNVMKDEPAKMVETVRDFYAAQKRREVRHTVCNDCFGLPRGPKQNELVQIETNADRDRRIKDWQPLPDFS